MHAAQREQPKMMPGHSPRPPGQEAGLKVISAAKPALKSDLAKLAQWAVRYEQHNGSQPETMISHSAANVGCEKGGQWELFSASVSEQSEQLSTLPHTRRHKMP